MYDYRNYKYICFYINVTLITKMITVTMIMVMVIRTIYECSGLTSFSFFSGSLLLTPFKSNSLRIKGYIINRGTKQYAKPL